MTLFSSFSFAPSLLEEQLGKEQRAGLYKETQFVGTSVSGSVEGGRLSGIQFLRLVSPCPCLVLLLVLNE